VARRCRCGVFPAASATSAVVVTTLLDGRNPRLLVPTLGTGSSLIPSGATGLDLNGRGMASSYMKRRTAGHTEAIISGDTRADWSEAFALVASLDVGKSSKRGSKVYTPSKADASLYSDSLSRGNGGIDRVLLVSAASPTHACAVRARPSGVH
jgi:hypothetical protein